MQAVIGIDIGGTSAKLALVDQGSIRERRQVPTGRDITFEDLVSDLAAAVTELRRSCPDAAISAVGVAAPGFQAPDGSGVVNVTNLPHIDSLPLRSALSDATGLDVRVDNDANAAALGEYRWGAGRDAKRLLCLTVGTGIGGGMVVDGTLHRVSWQGLGDPGHVVVLRDGPRCACGGAGCLEALAGTPGVLRRAAEMGGRFEDYPALVRARLNEGGPARRALEETGAWIGVGLAALTHVLGPDRILLGGGAVDAAGDVLVPAIEASFDRHVQPFLRERLTLGRAVLGNDAGVLGAAALVELSQ